MASAVHKVKELLFETHRISYETEKGLITLCIFIIDIIEFGLSGIQEYLPGKKHRKKTGKVGRKSGLNKSSYFIDGTAVTSLVSGFIRRTFTNVPVYTLAEEDLIDAIIKKKILERNVHFIGFDCEWVTEGNPAATVRRGECDNRPYFPIALLQIATTSECLLIRVCCLENSFPKSLKDALENRHILKLGVGIEEDCKRLRMLGIDICGAVDLRFLIQRCYHKTDIIKFPERINGLSLVSLTGAIVGSKMDKSYKVRCSNWESKRLTCRQIAYAANDSLAALQIFLALCIEKVQSKKTVHLSKCLEKIKPRPHGDDLLVVSFLLNKAQLFYQPGLTVKRLDIWKTFTSMTTINNEVTKVGFSLCQGIVDLAFKDKNSLFKKKPSSDTNLPKLSQKSVPVRKTPLYHNCILLAPDGCLLCTCDKKKAEWYVLKNLGTVVNTEPFTVQLNFDPAGRPFVDRDYYTTVKENRCVVCGKDDNYVKKMIVPRDYRRHFPSYLKDHLSHDVLLLCVTCHRVSELHDMRLKKQLAMEYSVPVGISKSKEDPKLKRVRSAAKALMYAGEKIPEPRKCSLRQVLTEFLKKDNVDDAEIRELSEIGTSKENEFYEGAHGERVVTKLIENGELKKFVVMWREHFLQAMKPKYLPEFWSIDHNISMSEKEADKE